MTRLRAVTLSGVEGLDIWDKLADVGDVCSIDHNRAVQTLLALALLLEKVASAVTLHSQLSGTRLTDSLFRAAV